jgi:hypothetical protein
MSGLSNSGRLEIADEAFQLKIKLREEEYKPVNNEDKSIDHHQPPLSLM